MHFSVRPVFQGERVLDSFNTVISGMKTKFLHLMYKEHISGLNIGTFNFFCYFLIIRDSTFKHKLQYFHINKEYSNHTFFCQGCSVGGRGINMLFYSRIQI